MSRALKKGTENRREERKNTVVFREREIKRTLYDPLLSYNIPNVFYFGEHYLKIVTLNKL